MEEQAACSLELPDQPMDCDICCSAPLVAAGLVTGQVFVYRYQQQQEQDSGASTSYSAEPAFQRPSKKKGPTGSCRAVAFTAGDGGSLLCGFEDGAILQLDSSTGKLQRKLPSAHSAAISRLLALDVGAAGGGGHVAAAGDESGRVQLWDLRAKQAVMSYTKHTDYISDLTLQEEEGCLVAVSGDGTLSVHDLKQGGAAAGKCRARSETDADDEMLSVVALKRGKKLAVGTQSGVLALYSWGCFNDCSDRFPGHPESIDALVAFDDDTLITGSSDGVLRIINVLPNKLLGVAGQHEDLPVEALALSGDRRVLASASHDNTVKLWDLGYLYDDEGDGNEEGSDEEGGNGAGPSGAGEATAAGSSGQQEGRPAGGPAVATAPGGEDGDGDSDDSDDSDAGGRKGKRNKRKREKTRMPKGNKQKRGASNFFSDLL